MALLEVLRAPLLLTPISDVAAGWAIATALCGTTAVSLGDGVPRALIAASACGVFLLGAGMAQNALADRADDAARKPNRPLPRGAVTMRTVTLSFGLLTLGALGASLAAPGTLMITLAIMALTGAYHYVLKPHRVAGCLTLGLLRGLDMLLGAVAATAGWHALQDLPITAFSPFVVCALYALYVTGAALHASTDDEPEGGMWSRAGLTLDMLLLLALGWMATTAPDSDDPSLLFLLAAIRLGIAWKTQPRPRVTGVALSNVYLLGAGICYGAGNLHLGTAVLVLFLVSRLLMRRFPPS
jgi:hypothetical protein